PSGTDTSGGHCASLIAPPTSYDLFAPNVPEERRRPCGRNRCPCCRLRSAHGAAFPKARTRAASRRRHSGLLVQPIVRSPRPPKERALYRRHICKVEDNNREHESLDRILRARGSVRLSEKYCTS